MVDDLKARLRRTISQTEHFATNRTAPIITVAVDKLVNPDGPEAADRIEELEYILRNIKGVGPMTRNLIRATLSDSSAVTK